MNNIIKSLFISAISIAGSLGLSAKSTAPKAHTSDHSNLIAGQLNVGRQIKVKATESFIDKLFPNEDEPEGDIYTEGWESQAVNCYNSAKVPNSRNIDVSKYCMPTRRGVLTSPYGFRKRFGRMHKGVDIGIPVGDTIYAAFDGRVRIVRNEGYRKGYGLYVVVRHNNELETVYGHLSKFLVKPNDYVKAGTPIALSGNTGHSTGPHLHFETRFMGYAINPQAIFDFKNRTTHTDVYAFNKATYQNARNYAPKRSEMAANDKEEKQQTAVSTPSGETRSRYYTVRTGDTPSKIAARNNTTVQTICQLNGIKATSRLTAGTKLRLQ